VKLWVLSDLHADSGSLAIGANPPAFDVFVCAGDVVTGDIAMAIELVAAIARGKPAVFTAGNHEWMSPIDAVLEYGRAAAEKHGVHWLELDTVEIGGVRFAGATLWTPLDVRYRTSVKSLQKANADVVVTHFPPEPDIILPSLAAGGIWIYGHHHGFSDRTLAGRRLIRNAVGYGAAEDLIDSEPPRADFTAEIGP
jgi:Icc-related predicted phosphoesterase